MMFRSLFFVAPALALDQQYKELLQRASSELSSGTLRSLEENLAAKGGCSKHIAALPAVSGPLAAAHYLEEDSVVKEWKDKFNYKRKVKNDVKISQWCAKSITDNVWKDADFKDTPCKDLAKTKKQCSKSLKATCNFVRSATKKLFKKALKGSRKVRKEAGFTAVRDPLKTKINEFSCKNYKKVKAADLKAADFKAIQDHYDAIYPQIVALKAKVTSSVAAKDAKKTTHKTALEKAKTDKDKCRDAADQKEEADKTAAAATRDAALVAADALATDDLKKTAKSNANTAYDTAVKKAKSDEDIAEKKCDDQYKADKKAADDAFKA